MTAKPNPLRLVEPAPEPEYLSYKDWLRTNRRSREWIIETTPKQAGDLEMTSQGFVRHD